MELQGRLLDNYGAAVASKTVTAYSTTYDHDIATAPTWTTKGTTTTSADGYWSFSHSTLDGYVTGEPDAYSWRVTLTDGTLIQEVNGLAKVQLANASIGTLQYSSPTELTIVGGAIAVTQSYHTVDTVGGAAASSDLDTITGGMDGMRITLRANHTDRSVVLKHGTGTDGIWCLIDKTLNDNHLCWEAIYDASLSLWLQTARP